MTIIGGANGPTSVFITPSMGWLNWFGLIIIALMMIPNIVYALRNRDSENKCTNRLVNLAEQIGRYGCMFLMVFNIGVAELGVASVAAFLVYLIGNVVLLLAYFVFWIVYGKKQSLFTAEMLALLPTLLFLLSGLTMRHWLLAGFAVLFGAAHFYITVVNAREAT
jgi:hypothetical protein